jgi:hypothetical protein
MTPLYGMQTILDHTWQLVVCDWRSSLLMIVIALDVVDYANPEYLKFQVFNFIFNLRV